jgi:hypothetical protein
MYDWRKGRQEIGRLEEEVDRGVVCRRFYLTLTASTLPRKLTKGLETSK